MRRGGYINHRRVCCGWFGLVSVPFLIFAAMCPFARRSLTARDSWDDADFIPIFHRRLLVLQKADVFFVHVNIDETANFALVIDEPLLDPWVAGLKFGNGVANGIRGYFDDFFVI